MKKLVITALAIGAMASCTKSTVQYEQPGEISLQPVTQKATKAAIDGNDYPEEGHFKVWALWTANAAESSASAIPETLNDNYVEYINGGELVKKKDFAMQTRITETVKEVKEKSKYKMRKIFGSYYFNYTK